jgi:uncharacterized protein YozE (UPF0346 family)
MALYFYSWLISERTPVDTSDKWKHRRLFVLI